MQFPNELCKPFALQWIIRSIPTLSYLIPLKGGNAYDEGCPRAVTTLSFPLCSVNKKGVDPPKSAPSYLFDAEKGTTALSSTLTG